MARVQLDVRGMTCAACERRVSRALDKVPGVVGVAVSVRRGRVSLRTRGAVPHERLHEAVRRAGYDIGREDRPWLSREPRVWRDVAIACAVLALLAVTLRATGATSLANQAGALAGSGGLAVIVLVGVAAGFSTCMALVGGVVLAVSARYAEQHRHLTARQRLRPQLAFNAGRVLGFVVLGAALGAFGSFVALNGRVLAVLLITVSVVMGLVGLRLSQVSPRLSAGAALTLPTHLSRLVRTDAPRRYSDRRTALLGAATFLLPCGFTQAVQVYAMSTGSPWRAGTITGLFALGTMPGLLGVGGLTAVVRGGAATAFFRFAGVAVVALAVVNLTGAVRLLNPIASPAPAASGPPPASAGAGTDGTARTADDDRSPPVGRSVEREAPAPDVSDNVTISDGIQVLRTTQLAESYEPADARVLAGVPVQWEIDSQALSCAASLYAPDLGVDYMGLEPGVTTLSFTLDEPGVYVYTCAMGMFAGTITAVAPPQNGPGFSEPS
jgi:sulfite exporter TauE/SafE/copper chaperone CopZ/plastocyanin